MPTPSGRTESVPVDHACLSSVATFYMERVFAETGTTYEDIAEAMAEAYMRTPEHARRVKLAPPCSPVGKEYARELGRIVTRLKKYHYHDGILPADLLIPLAEALPKPYRDDCLRAYARMMGFLGAQSPVSEGAPDMSFLPALCKESGEAIAALGTGLADGRIDAQDLAAAPSMIKELQDLIAVATSAIASISTNTGYQDSSKNVTSIKSRARGEGVA